MKVHPFKLTISLCLSIFLMGLYLPALASPGERGAPLAVEPFSALAFEEGAPADFKQSAAAGNNARLAGNPAAAERIYTKAFRQVVSSGTLVETWLPSSNLLSLYSDKTALYNPELAVIYGKLALNSLTSMAQGASLSLPFLFEQPQGLFEAQSALIYHQLGTELLQLQRYDEAEKVMQLYKQRELQELLGKQVSTETVQGIGLTSKEAESLTQLGLPSTESDSMKSWVGQSIRTLTRLVNSTEKAQVVSTSSLAESDPTHFKFRAGNAKQSLLYMGQGESLNLIQLGELDYSKLDLLTLSACETAVGGGVDEHGMEVEGLAASVLKAGARSVMGSLWSVSDQSTGLLMKEFYRQRSTGVSNNAQALRQAQLRLLKSQRSEFNHHFFWSAFTVSES